MGRGRSSSRITRSFSAPWRTSRTRRASAGSSSGCARRGICAVNAHTNLDCAPGGVNDELAAVLGLRDVTVLQPSGTDAQGRPWGLLRGGETDEQPLAEFLQTVKRALGCPGLRYVDGGKPVRRVAVGGGSCADGMHEALEAGCDTFVTADVQAITSSGMRTTSG